MKLLPILPVSVCLGLAIAAALPAETETESTSTSTLPTVSPSPLYPELSPVDPEIGGIDLDDAPTITGFGGPPDDCPECSDAELYESRTWSMAGLPILDSFQGDTVITLHSNGDVRFKTHFRNYDSVFRYKYGLACFIRDATYGEPAHVFLLSRGGNLGALKEIEVDQIIHSPSVAENWDNLLATELGMHCQLATGIILDGVIASTTEWIQEQGSVIGEIILLNP